MSDTTMAIASNHISRTGAGRETLRIGAVSYLNSKPLIEGLPEPGADDELILDYPSRLADDLADGQLDVALIPSVECLLHPEYVVVSDACVATHGPVLSVKLYSRVPAGEIRTLALDEGSRTSATLVRVFLEHRFGVHPEVQPLPLTSSDLAPDADAVLLIGDRAIHAPRESFHTVWDMGQEWLQWTGLPFVFAVWAARETGDWGHLAGTLSRARDRGVKNLRGIARREAPKLGISEQTAYDYLTQNLHFRLGSAERSGYRLFQELAAESGLVPGGTEVVFRTAHDS